MSPPSVAQIRDAWLYDIEPSVWFVRRNKTHADGCEWEVVHDWGKDCVGPETMKVVERFDNQLAAEQCAFDLEHDARAAAVLVMMQKHMCA